MVWTLSGAYARGVRTLSILLFFVIHPLSVADESLRTGAPKDCYLYSWGKGPDWVVKVTSEFQLNLLDRQMPDVDETKFEPTPEALVWTDRQVAPEISVIATVEGRQVVKVMYPGKGMFGKEIGVILL